MKPPSKSKPDKTVRFAIDPYAMTPKPKEDDKMPEEEDEMPEGDNEMPEEDERMPHKRSRPEDRDPELVPDSKNVQKCAETC